MKVGSIFTSHKENQWAWFGKKEEEMPKKFKNERSTGQVMLTVFCYRPGWVYLEFDHDAFKVKLNVTQDTYFNILMYLRIVIWFRSQGLLSQKVVLIHNNAHLHRAQLIQILLKDFHWEQFEHPPYLLDLAPSDYHLFPWHKN